jgi:hypothetical protein
MESFVSSRSVALTPCFASLFMFGKLMQQSDCSTTNGFVDFNHLNLFLGVASFLRTKLLKKSSTFSGKSFKINQPLIKKRHESGVIIQKS